MFSNPLLSPSRVIPPLSGVRFISRRVRWTLLALAGFLSLAVGRAVPGQEAPARGNSAETQVANEPVDYARDIRPILKARCFACHGSLKQEAGLRLDAVSLMRKGGDNGPAIGTTPGEASLLLARVSSTDVATRMPPEGEPLAPEQIAKLRSWLALGAAAPANDEPEPDPRGHWAFQAPVRPPVPTRKLGATPRNAIDAFILARLDDHQLSPRPRADKPTLLRRVYLDLIGLPPSREELHAFLEDNSPTAYERVVDRLLKDPRYGERWGRHWMDVWRYADWHGRRHVPDVWNSAPQLWRWRDWIVRSLNADHGYDRMVREMLAADEIAADDPSAAVATGFLIRNWYALNPNDWMRANVEHASKAFLGLTFHCAHCHDHKYDPILQDDYFRLRAFFEPINIRQDRVPGEADPGPFQEYSYGVLRKIQRLGAVQVYDKTPEAPTWYYTSGDERNRVRERGAMSASLPAFLGGDRVRIEPVALPAVAWYPMLRHELAETLLNEHRASLATLEQQLATARGEVAQTLPPLRDQVTQAEQAVARLESAPERTAASDALVGTQSLLLTAGTGRRVVQNGLAGLPSLETDAILSFQLRILEDAHVNFQLAKDLVAGLTASFVGFEKGRILAYQPGGYSEFQVGTYDWPGGERHLAVTLVIDRAADRALLSVTSVANGKTLVDRVPVALNGWNPANIPRQGLSFDARTGALAAVDAVRVSAPAGDNGQVTLLWECGFESPAFVMERDLEAIEGWQGSPFSQAPGASRVVRTLADTPLAAARRQLHVARRAVAARELSVTALEARRVAAQAEMFGIEARLRADRARYGMTPGMDVDVLTRDASVAYRAAMLRRAEADVVQHEQALAAAEAKPAGDANRAKEISLATGQLTAARDANAKAKSALEDPSQQPTYPPVGPNYPSTSTGRRKALALWMTDRQHPLTARVAVNHLWLRHFQAPLVASVFDFGHNGTRPTHPDLLDWLAVEFMESGWSMKHLHRLMVTSDAYQRVSSVGDLDQYAVDPENRLLWRMNTGRMEAEVVRDSLLYVAGRLDPRQGGQELENNEALTTTRRSLYYSCQPEIDGKSVFGALFDAPEPADCYRRTRSVIPQQALALSNSELAHATSEQLSRELWEQLSPQERMSPGAFITSAFEQILGRAPLAEELAACEEFLGWKPLRAGTTKEGGGGQGTAVDTAPQNTAPQNTAPQNTAPQNTAPIGPPAMDRRDVDEASAARLREGLIRVLLNHNDFIAIR